MRIHTFFDQRTWTLTHVVFDPDTRDAVVIDPVLDLDPQTWRVFQDSLDELHGFVKRHDLAVRWVLDTHAHADHITGMQALRERLPGARTAIGERITAVQQTFGGIFNLGPGFDTEGGQFDRLLADGDTLRAGGLKVEVLHTPGHTPACVSYKVRDAVFTGDALFMPDYGTGRCDFPLGSAHDLYESVSEKLYGLPDETRVFVGHDYQPGGREVRWETTIGASKRSNVQLDATTTRQDYVEFRRARDATLSAPKLLVPSIQVNIAAGALPAPEDNGVSYLKVPLKVLGGG